MKTKKIIAREFLFLIGTILFLVITYGCLIINNIYQERQIQKITNKLLDINNQYQNFLSRPLKFKHPDITQEKLDDFANFLNEHPYVNQKTIYSTIIELDNDSILLNAPYDFAATTKAQKYKYKKNRI